MATVIGITAQRALEIENASVTSGYIDENGYLILVTKGGEEFNAGWTLNDLTSLELDMDAIKLELPIIHGDVIAARAELDKLEDGTHPVFQEIHNLIDTVKDNTIVVHRTPEKPTDLNNTTDLLDLWVNPSDPSDVWRWEGSTLGWVVAEQDVSDFYVRMDQAENRLTELQDTTIPGLNARLTSIDNWVLDASGDIGTIDTRINSAVSTASTGLQGMIDTVDGKATDAQDAAQQAASAAASASGIATAKSDVLIQSAAPPASMRKASTLWIDTTGGNNTPKRWSSGTTWLPVSDKVAIDAADAAVAAASAAAAADSKATLAQQSADGKSTVTYGSVKKTINAAGSDGDTHYVFSGGEIIAMQRRNASGWLDAEMAHTVLSSLDVGKVVLGEMHGKHVQAKTLVADSLLITDFTNLIDNSEFAGGTDLPSIPSWNYGGLTVEGTTVTFAGDRVSERALRFSGGSHAWVHNNRFVEVVPHEDGTMPTYFLQFEGMNRRGGNLRLELESYKANKSLLLRQTISIPGAPGSDWVVQTGNIQVPVDTRWVRARIVAYAGDSETGVAYALKPVIRQMDNGELIVDGTLTGNKFRAKSIFTNSLAIGSGNNLIPDSEFANAGAAWSGSFSVYSNGGLNDAPSIIVPAAVGQSGTYLGDFGEFKNYLVPVIEGETYRLGAWVRSGSGNIPINGASIYIRAYNSAGSYVGNNVKIAGNTTLIGMSSFSRIDGLYTVPPGRTHITIGLFTEMAYGYPSRWSQPFIQLATDGSLIVENSIFARHIDTNSLIANLVETDLLTALTANITDAWIEVGWIKNLTVSIANITGGLTYTTASGRFLNTDLLAAGSITASKVMLSNTSSMIPWNIHVTLEPHQIQSGAQVTNGTDTDVGWCAIIEGGTVSDGSWGSVLKLNSGTRGRNGVANDFEVEPGASYRFRMGVGGGGSFPTGVARDLRVAFAAFRRDGTYYWIITPSVSNPPFAATTDYPAALKYIDYLFKVDDDVVDLRPYIQKTAWSGGIFLVTDPLLVRASSAELIVDGAITSDKITTDDIYNKSFKGSTFILADDQGGEYIRFAPVDPIHGNPSIAKFGVGKDVVVITDDGVVSGRHGSFDTVDIGGDTIDEVLAKTALGVVARSAVDAFPPDATFSAPRGLTELRFQTRPGGKREYRIVASRLGVAGTTYETIFRVHYTTNGTRPTIDSPVLVTWSIPAAGINSAHYLTREWAADGNTDVRLLLSMRGWGGNTGWIKDVGAEFSVIDEGPFIERTGVAVAGTSAPSNPIQTYTKEYNSNWSRSYMGNNNPRSVEDGNLYQGQTPYWTAGGIQRSLIGFPSTVMSDLTGADIQRIEVYLRFAHWHGGAGGTAVIGTHGHTTRPGTFSHSAASVVTSSGWGRGVGRWVTLPAGQHALFQSGTRRGISLYINSGGTLYYGYASPSAKLRVIYKK